MTSSTFRIGEVALDKPIGLLQSHRLIVDEPLALGSNPKHKTTKKQSGVITVSKVIELEWKQKLAVDLL